MPERSDRHGWIDLLVPDGPFLSAAALDVQTVGENWPTRLSAEQRSLLTAPPASEAEEGEGWDDSSWDGRRARVTELLSELLGYREGKTLTVAPGIAAHHHIYRARVTADFVIHAPDDPGDARMVVICGPDATDDPSRLDPARTHTHDGWVSTPVQRAALLARHADADLALVTNGREHLLVNVVTGTTGSAMWTVNGLEDRHARDAFVALLHKQRVLHRTVPLSKLIELSQDRQHELTDTLGKQVRRAAEAVVNAISRANRTSRGRLLEGLTGQQVYAATTRVLMRTVFLLVAEERGLLPVAENQLFADQYAMSTLLNKLEEDAYRNRSAMERRAGAWQRMMALSRAVHAGIEHDDLRLPAYGGNLFDPDEHPFLEARVTAADGEGFEQLNVGVVDDFTVLTMLRHLQIADGQRISFRSLDVEQIGHVYEALLDHSAVIVPEDQVAVLGLIGKAGNEPEVSLVELEGWTAKSEKELGKQLVDLGVAAEARGVYRAIDDGLAPDSEVAQTLNVAVANDAALRERVERYAPLLRTDARGVALVFRPGDVYVTETSSKRDSGTAYTPRSLAEEVAKHTLDPLIYDPGPQNEPDESRWRLKAPGQILKLKICDPAVGSAAILVAAVRYLAEALLQARVEVGELSPAALASGASDVESMDARVQARRAIVARCIYGVDRDPMAVEMAKLSLWLITMARDEAFTFLDHAIRHGDSLLGITSLDQLRRLHLDPASVSGAGRGQQMDLTGGDWFEKIQSAINRAQSLRGRIHEVDGQTVDETALQARWHREAEQALDVVATVADAVVVAGLASANKKAAEIDAAFSRLQPRVAALPQGLDALVRHVDDTWATACPELPREFRRPLHWPLAFPEVFDRSGGFSAMLGNPPFLGGKRISPAMGSNYREFLVRYVGQAKGNADLVSYFLRQASHLATGFGFIATNTVYQGDTRAVGLDVLAQQGDIYRAEAVTPWPGAAAVVVSKVWWSRRRVDAPVLLDGVRVQAIASDLYPWDIERTSRPRTIRGQNGLGRVGIVLRGIGFVLSEEEREAILRECPGAADVVYPYVSGSDLNKHPRQESERYCIHLGDLSLAEACERYPAVVRHLEEHVKPYRLKLKTKRLADNWWLPEVPRLDMMEWFAANERLLALAQVSSRVIPVRVPTGPVFSHKVIVILDDDPGLAGVLTSSAHRVWVDRYSSTMKTDISYSPTDCLENFPFPSSTAEVAEVFEDLETYRQGLFDATGEGITGTYRRYHDPNESAPEIGQLREFHERLDHAVLVAYGWQDLAERHRLDFHDTRYGHYYIVPTEERYETLQRLLALNAEQSRKVGT